ncbi:MAG: hypothetical protein P8Y80_09495 [Acidobacteriota bacterium]
MTDYPYSKNDGVRNIALDLILTIKMAQGINEIQEENNLREAKDLPLICLLLAIFQLVFVSLAIQQLEINKFYGATSDSE